MPAATDLVLNNGAGTPVAKTFTLVSPAAGDNSLATWALKEGTISSVFPKISSLARKVGGDVPSRRSQWSLYIPSSYTDSVTGLTRVGSGMSAEIKVTVADDFPEALKNDAVAFLMNLAANAAVFQAAVRDGAPTT